MYNSRRKTNIIIHIVLILLLCVSISMEVSKTQMPQFNEWDYGCNEEKCPVLTGVQVSFTPIAVTNKMLENSYRDESKAGERVHVYNVQAFVLGEMSAFGGISKFFGNSFSYMGMAYLLQIIISYIRRQQESYV